MSTMMTHSTSCPTFPQRLACTCRWHWHWLRRVSKSPRNSSNCVTTLAKLYSNTVAQHPYPHQYPYLPNPGSPDKSSILICPSQHLPMEVRSQEWQQVAQQGQALPPWPRDLVHVVIRPVHHAGWGSLVMPWQHSSHHLPRRIISMQ